MFKKKIINASSNLKRDLHLRTKIKSNGWLHIATERVYLVELMYAFDSNFSFLWQNLINSLRLHQHFSRLNDLKNLFGPQWFKISNRRICIESSKQPNSWIISKSCNQKKKNNKQEFMNKNLWLKYAFHPCN